MQTADHDIATAGREIFGLVQPLSNLGVDMLHSGNRRVRAMIEEVRDGVARVCGGNPLLALYATIVTLAESICLKKTMEDARDKAVEASRAAEARMQEMEEALEELSKRRMPVQVISHPFQLPGDVLWSVHAIDDTGFARPYRIVGQDPEELRESLPGELPYTAYVEPSTQSLLTLADGHLPCAPSMVAEVMAVPENEEEAPMVMIELEAGPGQQVPPLVPVSKHLAAEARQRMDDGESVRVTIRQNVAISILKSERKHFDWLFPITQDGENLDCMVFPPRLRKQWMRDVRNMVARRGTMTCLVGPAGCGKTSAVARAMRTAMAMADTEGRPFDEAYLIELSVATIGSAYIYETPREAARAIQWAAARAAKFNSLCVVILDEADQLLGQSTSAHGTDHGYERQALLVLQSKLGSEIPGVAVYMTQNENRPGVSLPPAIRDRFRTRAYPARPTRTQIARVAALRVSPETLATLELSEPQAFGNLVADNLFGNRPVCRVHTFKGDVRDVHARDVAYMCSPRAVERLCVDLNRSVQDEEVKSIFDLHTMLDEMCRPVDLRAANIVQHTYLGLVQEEVKEVEAVRRVA